MEPRDTERGSSDNGDDDDSLVVDLITDEAGVGLVRIVGELDLSNVNRVRAITTQALERGATRIVFDLAGIDFIDSSGVTVLLETVHQTDSVTIRQPSRSALRVIETTGLASILRIEP